MKRCAGIVIFMLMISGCLETEDPEVHFLREIMYDEFKDYIAILDNPENTDFQLNVVDIREKTDYLSGHIRNSVNIETNLVIDTAGYVVNQARALTERFDKQTPILFYSHQDDTIVYTMAKLAQLLEFKQVYFYEGGIEEWQNIHGNYLNILYTAFKAWHQNHFPFENRAEVLIDIHPSTWYHGIEVLEGHIPGALNLPVDSLVEFTGEEWSLINGGKFLTDSLSYRSARMIIYDTGETAEQAEYFLKAVQTLGYTHLFLFSNGYDEWISNGNQLDI
ncbi:MAG: hypothetical protein K9J30_03565 [Bacteroidales bacterium]|nr:hypothetical protein [Bacteroidales bacterium]